MIKRHRTHRRMDLNLVVDFIREYTREHEQSPTIREIGNAMGDRSTSVVRYGLAKLERDGRIKREHGIHRAIVVIEPANRESPK